MRKVSITTSQDGGDSTSITSGVENEIKKTGAGIMKSKKTSIKRKVQNFSLESDDGVIEPLLQKDKEKTENSSAKFLLSKTKTESTSEKRDDKDRLLEDNKGAPSMTSVPSVIDNQVLANGVKDNYTAKSYASASSIHNHKNRYAFTTYENKSVPTPKSQFLVEIDGGKQKGDSPSPLIFTTAKIHTDGKTKPLEPVQVTPVPILSTVEANVVKTSTGSNLKDKNTVIFSNKSDNNKNNVAVTPSSIISNTVHCSGITSIKDAPFTAPLKISLNTSNNPTITSQSLSEPSSQPSSSVPAVTKIHEGSQPSKDKISPCVSSPQASHSGVSVADKSAISKDVKSAASFTSTTSTKTEGTLASTVAKVNIVTGTRELEMDINKNIQTTSIRTSTSQSPQSLTSVNNKTNDDVSGKDEISKTTSSSLTKKSLQRQKNSTTDDTTVSDTTKVPATSSAIKESRIPEDKVNSSKTPGLIKQTEPEVSKTVKTVLTSPNISANNNTVSSLSKPSTKTTAASTMATKCPQTTTITTKTSTQSSKLPSTVKSTSEPKPASKIGKTTTQSTVTPVKGSPSNTTASSTKSTTTKTVTTTGVKSDKAPSAVSTTQTNSSASTAGKAPTVSTSKSTPLTTTQATVKPSVVSTVKTITSDTSIPKLTTHSNSTSIPSKTPTVTTMKASTVKAPSATKPAQSKSTSPSTGTSSTVKPNAKQSDLKRSESKDDKSKA